MNILWCGGEDIDFLDSGAVNNSTNSGHYRTSYARYGVSGASGGFRRSHAFPGGAITSCWASAQCGQNNGANTGRFFGVVSSSVGTARGLWVGANASGQVLLFKYDDTTMTTLGTSVSIYYPSNTNTIHKIDIQIISYGASATVNVYLDYGLAITYTGDVTVSGVSTLDAVGLGPTFGNSSMASEIIVSDSDTRSLSLMTMAPTGVGTTDQWTGAASDVNELTTSDATVVTTNTATNEEQFNVTDLPSGTFAVIAVKVAARAAMTADSTPTGLKLGFNSGGSVGLGSTLTPAVTFSLNDQIFSTNPVTSAAWLLSDMNALQLELKAV